MLDQPDHILSTAAAHEAALHGRYNFFSAHYIEDPFHEKVIHKSLARNLNDLIPAMEDEVKYSIDTVFGFDTKEWKKVNVWKSWLAIVPYITNMFLIGFTPTVLRPVVGRIASWANWWHWKQSSKLSLPIITKRIHDMQRKEAGDPEYVDWTPPEDFITWTIRIAKQDKNEFESSPEVISKRIMPLEFAATHTTSLTGHGVVLDLLSSDPALGYLEGIREEAARVLQEEGGHWTKSGLARLFRLDSAIRESMRVSNFAQTLVERKVVIPEGITNEKEGWHVPFGQYFILNLNGIHHDNELFPNADTFDAFRYSKQREEYEARSQDEKDSEEGLRLKKMGMVTTGDTHLAFGHGRHACPGRFFVAHELKMALAYLLLNYDVKRLPERPKIRWIGPQFLPPMDACIEVRRRKSAFVS
jgi:cytochrome P450